MGARGALKAPHAAVPGRDGGGAKGRCGTQLGERGGEPRLQPAAAESGGRRRRRRVPRARARPPSERPSLPGSENENRV